MKKDTAFYHRVFLACSCSAVMYWYIVCSYWVYVFLKVKELIRRAKAWRNMVWAGNKDGRPKSYLLSLLVITAYHRTPGASIGYRLKSYAHR